MEAANVLLDAGADITTSRENKGDDLLMMTIFKGNVDIALLLIKAGIDTHRKNSAGYTVSYPTPTPTHTLTLETTLH